jgi:peptide/nickel transport system substrate-binding protein
VRQALAYATDRSRFITTVLDGQALQADSPIPAGTWAYSAVLDRYPFNPDEAVRLLDQTGWTLQPNGVRAKDGQELRLSIVTNEDAQRLAIAQEIGQAWTAMGMPTEVSAQGPTTLLRDFLTARLFLVALYGFDGGPDPDPYTAYHTSQARPGGNNLAGFSNSRRRPPPADRAPDQRRHGATGAVPTVPGGVCQRNAQPTLFQRTFTYVVDKQLQGVGQPVLFDSSSRFVNVREWRIDGG